MGQVEGAQGRIELAFDESIVLNLVWGVAQDPGIREKKERVETSTQGGRTMVIIGKGLGME